MLGVPESLATVVLGSLSPIDDPSTEPEAIAARHRCEVRAYLRQNPRATVGEVSAALALPIWNIERALAEMRGEPVPYRVKSQAGKGGYVPALPRKRRVP